MRLVSFTKLSIICLMSITASQATAFDSATLHGTPKFGAAAYSPTGDQLIAEYNGWILKVDGDYRDDTTPAFRRFTPLNIPRLNVQADNLVRSIHFIDSTSALRLGKDAVIVKSGADPEIFFETPEGETLSAGAFSSDHSVFALVNLNRTSQLLTYRLFSGDLSSNEPILELETETLGVPGVTPFFVPESNNLLFPISIDKVQEVRSDGTVEREFNIYPGGTNPYNTALWLTPDDRLLGHRGSTFMNNITYEFVQTSKIVSPFYDNPLLTTVRIDPHSQSETVVFNSQISSTGRYSTTMDGMIRWDDGEAFERKEDIPVGIAINDDPAVVFTGTDEWSFSGERFDFDVLYDTVRRINKVSDDGRYIHVTGPQRAVIWDSENYDVVTERNYSGGRTFHVGQNLEFGILSDFKDTLIFDEANPEEPIAEFHWRPVLAYRDLSTEDTPHALFVIPHMADDDRRPFLRLLELENGEVTVSYLRFDDIPLNSYVSEDMVFSDDGTKLITRATIEEDRMHFLIYDIASNSTTIRRIDEDLGFRARFFSPNGRYYIHQDENIIHVYETENFVEVNRWENSGLLHQVGANNELFIRTETGLLLLDGNTGEELAVSGPFAESSRSIIADGFVHARTDNDSFVTLTYQEKSDFNMVEIARLLADRPTPVTEGDLNGDGVVDAGDLIRN